MTAHDRAPTSLTLDHVASGYGDLRVIRDLSLTVASGSLELVLGRNGVGKTTLLSMAAGLLPAWDGAVLLGDDDVTKRPAYRRAADGIVLVQQGKRVFHQLTLLQNVSIGSFAVKMGRKERRDHSMVLLSQFPRLEGRENQPAGALSGGQQQMLAIAQALAAKPRVLLLDEPSAGLSPAIVAEVFEHIGELRDTGMTVVLVEQLVDQALPFADHVSVINDGQIVTSGAPSDFNDTAQLQQAYFGSAPSPVGV